LRRKPKSILIRLAIALLLIFGRSFISIAFAQECGLPEWDEGGGTRVASGKLSVEVRGGDEVYIVQGFGLIVDENNARLFRNQLRAVLGQAFDVWLSKDGPGKAEVSMTTKLGPYNGAKPEWKAVGVFRLQPLRGQALGFDTCTVLILDEHEDWTIEILFKPARSES
jgi:hypothetical protein